MFFSTRALQNHTIHIGIIDFFLVQPAYYALVGHDARLVQGGLPVDEDDVARPRVAVHDLAPADPDELAQLVAPEKNCR